MNAYATGATITAALTGAPFGDFNMHLNYIHTGKHLDFDSTTVVANATDILDVNFSKDFV